MGSCTFTQIITTTKSATEAYDDLVEQARYEWGSEPYNGTISTTDGLHEVPSKPLTIAQAAEIVSERIATMSKYEPCQVLPLVTQSEAVYETVSCSEPLSVEVPVDADDETIARAVHRAAKVRYSAHNQVSGTCGSPVTVKRTVRATKGASTTTFYVVWAGSFPKRHQKGYSSQAEARAALSTMTMPGQWEVLGVTRRADGSGLVEGTITGLTCEWKGRLTTRRLLRPETVGTERTGWYFYGVAAT